MTDQRMHQDAICYQWFKQRLSVTKPSISQWSQIKEDTVELSGLVRNVIFLICTCNG